MSDFTDQLNRTSTLPETPKRIVSLVPSLTELLYDLGLREEVVGITKFCVHPNEWFRTKTRIGGTKNIKFDVIQSLQPDLIIANKEENVKEQVEVLETLAPVCVTDINNLSDALSAINLIGEITGTTIKAKELTETIESNFIKYKPRHSSMLKTAYLIWKAPYMTAGGDTFIHTMLNYCGFENVFATTGRYPSTTLEELKQLNCELVLLSSEPYPFKDKHIAEIKSVLPNATVLLVDGEMFSWYGSRLLHAPEYYNKIQSTI